MAMLGGGRATARRRSASVTAPLRPRDRSSVGDLDARLHAVAAEVRTRYPATYARVVDKRGAVNATRTSRLLRELELHTEVARHAPSGSVVLDQLRVLLAFCVAHGDVYAARVSDAT